MSTQVRVIAMLRDFDAIYVRHHPAALPVALASRLLRVPRIEEVNGTLDDWWDVHDVPRILQRTLMVASRLCLRTADAVVAVNSGLCAWGASFADIRNCQVIPNGVDPDVFTPASAAPDVGRPYAAYVGALVPWEGVTTLLGAIHSPQWPADIDLVIAGDGPMRAQVQEAAQGRRLHYLGPVAHRDVPQLVRGAAVAVSPYDKKPWGASPIKLYEAMACAVAVVASDSPGQAEIVSQEECGLLFPSGNADALAAAVSELVNDRQAAKDMGKRGREAVLARHTWTHRAEETSRLIRRLADKGSV